MRRTGQVTDGAHTALNAFIIHLSLSALILLQIHSVTLSPSLLYAALMPWLLFAANALLFCIVGRALQLPRCTTGALVVVAGLGNTSFVGLPMIEAFYGPGGLPTGIVIDQLGTYLVLSTVGIMLICFYSGGTITRRQIAMRIAKFPPLIASEIAIAFMPVSYPTWLVSVLSRLGGTLAPLALVSVGLQLKLRTFQKNRMPLAMGIRYKLVLGPLLMLASYVGVMGFAGSTTEVMLFESAMGLQIGASIVASQYGLNAEFV